MVLVLVLIFLLSICILDKKHYSLMDLMIHRHTVITLGKTSKKTSKRTKSSNPKWEENFVFIVNEETGTKPSFNYFEKILSFLFNPQDIFKVEVFEGILMSPRLLGQYSAPVSEFKNHHCVGIFSFLFHAFHSPL